MEAPKKTILITGSSGMLGIDLSRELNKVYRICGMDLVPAPIDLIDFHKGDITSIEDVEEVVKKTGPDLVIHAAAMTDVDGCEFDKSKAYSVNAEGTKNVALTSRGMEAALVYISTDFVFDGLKTKPYKEDDIPCPLNAYGSSKLEGEKTIQNILKKYFIVRTSWLYGKHGKNFVDTIIKRAEKEKVIKVVRDQVGSPTYTKDLSMAIHALINKIFDESGKTGPGAYGIYHISNSGIVSWYEYAKEILRLTRSRTKVVPISAAELDRPAKRPAMSAMDNSKFTRFTAKEMRNWKEALNEYVAD